MSDWLTYSIQVNVVLSGLYAMYWCLFRRMSFFRLNRFTLLGIMLFSLCSPVLQLPLATSMLPPSMADWQGAIELPEEAWEENAPEGVEDSRTIWLSWVELLYGVYLLGLLITGARLLSRLWNVYQLRRTAVPVRVGQQAYFQTQHPAAPFVVGPWMFLPSATEYPPTDSILIHESAHIKQWHAFDLCLVECFGLVFWMNPIVYALKREMRQVHEYLADDYVMQAGHDLRQYLERLKQYTARSQAQDRLLLPQMFTSSTLFKRVQMMTKVRTASWKKGGYLAWIPAMALIMMAFTPQSEQFIPISPESSAILSIEQAAQAVDSSDDEVPSIHPIGGNVAIRVTSGFGMRMHPMTKKEQFHRGEDYAAPLGTPVVATASGIIVENRFKDPKKGYGRLVIIKHGEEYVTRYAHLDSFEAKVGQRVTKGDIIGTVGSSGQSFAPHLHYEIFKNGKPQNPAEYYAQ